MTNLDIDGRRTSLHLPGVRADVERGSIVALGALLKVFARLMIRLARVRAEGLDEVQAARAAGRRLVFVSWHGFDLCNLGVFPVLFGRDSRAVIMAPMTKEGRVMEQLARGFGYEVIPISPEERSTVSARAVVEIVTTIKSGADGLIAVDGPYGPPEHVKLGAAVIAKRAGAVIVPTAVAGSAQIRIRSRWDRHLLIPPFARMIMHFGPLIDTHPADGPAPSPEEIRERIEVALRAGVARAQAVAQAGE